jgi:hypothetical protein
MAMVLVHVKKIKKYLTDIEGELGKSQTAQKQFFTQEETEKKKNKARALIPQANDLINACKKYLDKTC